MDPQGLLLCPAAPAKPPSSAPHSLFIGGGQSQVAAVWLHPHRRHLPRLRVAELGGKGDLVPQA